MALGISATWWSSGVISLAGSITAPNALGLWQSTARHLEIAERCDLNSDGNLTAAELRECGKEETSGAALALSERGYAIETLYKSMLPELVRRHKLNTEAARANISRLRWGTNGFQFSLDVDDTPIIERLRDIDKPVFLYFGAIDSLTSLREQQNFLAQNQHKPRDLTVRVFEGLGHNFGKHETDGAIDETVVQQVLDDVKTIMQKPK
jgi:hypothetical protein